MLMSKLTIVFVALVPHQIQTTTQDEDEDEEEDEDDEEYQPPPFETRNDWGLHS